MVSSQSVQSVESQSSSDYAVPPDEVSIMTDSDNSEPEQKLLKYTADFKKVFGLVYMYNMHPLML